MDKQLRSGRPLLTRGPFNGEFFRTACAQQRLTGRDIADKLGCSDQTVYSWCNGRARPDDDTVAALAKMVKVSVKALRGEQ